MSLELFLHPAYCHKVLIAFYENDIPCDAPECTRLSRPFDGTPLLCARAGRGEAVHAPVTEVTSVWIGSGVAAETRAARLSRNSRLSIAIW